ncbi:MAG: radical SAM protein, partial [Endomicrobia bacterium]|nr:radical SAM protein [Endomicrobiia bacterium]
KIAKQKGLKVLFHTNGSINPEPLKEILKYVDAVTVDLKGFNKKFYSEIPEADLEHILQILKIIRQQKKTFRNC